MDFDLLPKGLALALLAGAIFIIPIAGWIPLVSVLVAVLASAYLLNRFRRG